MKRLVRWAGRLYPSAWRQRYGAEFDALLDQAQPASGDLWDVLRGAFVMRMIRVNFLTITVAFALAGALIAGMWALTRPSRYVSTALVRAELNDPAVKTKPGAAQQWLSQGAQQALSRGSLSEIIQRPAIDLYRTERTMVPLEDIIVAMRKNINIRIRPEGRVNEGPGVLTLAVEFLDHDPDKAQRTAEALVARLQKSMPTGGALQVLNPASPPIATVPDFWRNIRTGLLAGLAAGLFCGMVWTLVRNRKRWSLKHVGAFAVAGMMAGIVIAMLIPDQYESTAVLRSSGTEVGVLVNQVVSDEVLTGIIRTEGLYRTELERSSMTDILKRMRNKFVQVRAVDPESTATYRRAFTISFRGGDRAQTQRVVGALVAACIDGNLRAGTGGTVEVLDPASLPTSPTMPNRLQIAVFGAIGGLLLGFVFASFRGPAMAAA